MKKKAKKTKAKKAPKSKKKQKVQAKARKKSPAKKSRPARRQTKKTAAKARRPSAQPPAQPTVIAPPNSAFLGEVEDYFAHVGVVALTLERALALGQRIQVLGHTTHLELAVDSMQIDHQPVQQADAKDAVGIKVPDRARRGDKVFLLL